jgi:hypothetical protein
MLIKSARQPLASYILSLLGKPINPFELVHVDDGSTMSSLSLAIFNFARRGSLDGFRVTAFYPCFIGLRVSLPHEGYAVTPASGELELSSFGLTTQKLSYQG